VLYLQQVMLYSFLQDGSAYKEIVNKLNHILGSAFHLLSEISLCFCCSTYRSPFKTVNMPSGIFLSYHILYKSLSSPSPLSTTAQQLIY